MELFPHKTVHDSFDQLPAAPGAKAGFLKDFYDTVEELEVHHSGFFVDTTLTLILIRPHECGYGYKGRVAHV